MDYYTTTDSKNGWVYFTREDILAFLKKRFNHQKSYDKRTYANI